VSSVAQEDVSEQDSPKAAVVHHSTLTKQRYSQLTEKRIQLDYVESYSLPNIGSRKHVHPSEGELKQDIMHLPGDVPGATKVSVGPQRVVVPDHS